ncbi:MAG TPA: RluA family pseudouridine synthase [Buchnera sp. (in: enterobacteria)]|nr:RluA family pseudouridine synthase [Buchnera sp. (in: enterobacteria)]
MKQNSVKKKLKLKAIVPKTSIVKERLDHVLVHLFNSYSRSILKKLILDGKVIVDNKIVYKPSQRLFGGEKIFVFPEKIKNIQPHSENIKINIIYQDEDILVIDKSSNLVVHPYPGNNKGTLLNALMFYDKNINLVPRCGIVHRLDKNTTGLMVIARNFFSYNILKKLIKNKKIKREYRAIVNGNVLTGGLINEPIRRHLKNRMKMIIHSRGKKSITHYRIIKRFKSHTYLRIFLETGRTHQIRVHMLHINHSIVGDPIYKNNKNNFFWKLTDKLKEKLLKFPRQALHANKLSFVHPTKKINMSWKSRIPLDMREILVSLQEC